MAERSQKTILVVDDVPEIRALFQSMLEAWGYRVVTGEDGGAALKQLRQGPVHLLILDLVMPGKEGLETIAVVRKKYPKLKILVVSGFEDYFLSAQMFGAHETMTKPVDADTLRQRVEVLIGE